MRRGTLTPQKLFLKIQGEERFLAWRGPSNFLAGKIRDYYDEWHLIFESNDTDCEVCEWVYRGVDIFRYMQPFKGNFRGEHYDVWLPQGSALLIQISADIL